jgi:hypothetical protein
MPTPNIQTQIDFLIDLISQGKSYTQSLDVIGRKWTLSESTFKRRWDMASEQHSKAQELLNAKANDALQVNLIDAQKTALKRKQKRLDILNEKFEELAEVKIMKLNYTDADGKKQVAKISNNDYLKTIEVMTKLDDRISKAEGTDAPARSAQTNSKGEDITDTGAQIIIMPMESIKMIPNEPEM